MRCRNRVGDAVFQLAALHIPSQVPWISIQFSDELKLTDRSPVSELQETPTVSHTVLKETVLQLKTGTIKLHTLFYIVQCH